MMELWSAGKRHSDEKPAALFIAERFAKTGKILTVFSTLRECFRMHQNNRSGFTVHLFDADIVSLLELPAVLSDRAPPQV